MHRFHEATCPGRVHAQCEKHAASIGRVRRTLDVGHWGIQKTPDMNTADLPVCPRRPDDLPQHPDLTCCCCKQKVALLLIRCCRNAAVPLKTIPRNKHKPQLSSLPRVAPHRSFSPPHLLAPMLQGGALSLSANARTQGQAEVAALPWARLTAATALQQHLQEHHIAPAAAQASSIDAELRVLEPQLRRLATGAAPSTQAEDADDASLTSAAPADADADADAGAATKVAAPQPRRLCRDLRRRVAQLVRDAAPLQRHAWFMSFLLKMPQVSGEGADRVDVAWLQTAERGAWQQLARIDVALEAAERSLRQACLRQAEWDMLLHAAMRLDAAAPVVEVKRHIALLPALDHEARLRHAATGLVSALRTYA